MIQFFVQMEAARAARVNFRCQAPTQAASERRR
jgi:hypothetical protein